MDVNVCAVCEVGLKFVIDFDGYEIGVFDYVEFGVG